MHEFVISMMDRDNLFKLGLTACAVGISFFILWGPKLSSKRGSNNGALIGLQNLGLTCFLNSLLQALASCPHFIKWLEQYQGNGRVTDSLISVLNLLCYERQDESRLVLDQGTYSPRDLISALSHHGWAIAPQEQDAHELFLLLVTTLEEEEHKASNYGKGSLSDALATLGGGTEDVSREVTSHGDLTPSSALPSHYQQTKSVSGHGDLTSPRTLASPFRGYLTCQLKCMSCNYRSPMRYDKFDTLSLHLPSREGTVSLLQLLEGFVRTEVLDDFVCDACNKDKSPGAPSLTSRAIKTVRIGKLPKCLCLHISRTYMSADGVVYKRDNYVDFPEYLSMASYTHNAMLQRDLKMKQTLFGLNAEAMIKFPKSSNNNSSILDSDPKLTMYRTLHESESEGSDQAELSLVNRVKNNGCLEPTPRNGVHDTPPPPPTKFINGLTQRGRQEYRLKAVVEHKGSVDGGHFVTYRKGPLQSNTRHRCTDSQTYDSRWFYTSDADIRKSSMCDALLANAYMLFYEKCSPSYMDT